MGIKKINDAAVGGTCIRILPWPVFDQTLSKKESKLLSLSTRLTGNMEIKKIGLIVKITISPI